MPLTGVMHPFIEIEVAMRRFHFLELFMAAGLIFSASTAASDEVYAVLDSLAGTAQIQKAGQQKWREAACRAKLGGNDIVRVLDSSFARVRLPDGSTTFVRANSQIMITFYESREPNILSTHITVLFGAAFFVIKEILPKALTRSFDTKIYTPTSVVAIRGTSFCMEVDPKNGATVVKVTNGTVQVRNILKDAYSFISPGFKTAIELKIDPIVSTPVLDQELAQLKTWVPPPVIEKEIQAQLAKAKRDHDVLTSDFKDKIVIMPFVNRSKYAGKWEIGTGFAEQLSEQLRMSNKETVLYKADSSGADPLRVGGAEKARLVVLGEIEDFDIIQRAEITAAADEYKEYYLAKVHVRVTLIDVAQNKTAFEKDFTGETRGKNVKDNSWQKIGAFSFDQKDSRFTKSILGSSTLQVLDQAVEKIVQWSHFD
jgi:hypothetical protein